MSNNITVTGNEAQFNENVTFLKDVKVNGNLQSLGELLDIFSDLKVHGRLTSEHSVVENEFIHLAGPATQQGFPTGIATFQGKLQLGIGTETDQNIYLQSLTTLAETEIDGTTFIVNSYVADSFGVFHSDYRSAGSKSYNENALLSVIGNNTGGGVGINTENPKRTLHVRETLEGQPVSTLFDTTTKDGSNVARRSLIAFRDDATTTAFDSNEVGPKLGSQGDDLVFDTLGVGGVNDTGEALRITSNQRVGIGSTLPDQKLDVMGSVRIDEFIYDSGNSPGQNGWYLNRDEWGIRWVAVTPSFTEGIYVQDEGQYIPFVGAAKSFTTLNYVSTDSQGIGTDTVVPIVDPSNPEYIARIQTQSYWGFTGTGDNASIYRKSKVGIYRDDPTVELDVDGAFILTGAADLENTLDVGGDTKLKAALEVTDSTTLNNTLDVTDATTLNSTLTVSGDTILNSATTSSNKDSGALVVEGGVGIEENLNVGGKITVESSTSSSNKDSGALVVKSGGVGIEENLNVGGIIRVSSNATSSNKDTGALIVDSGGLGVEENLNVGGNAKITGTFELDSSLIDINQSAGGPSVGQTDYRLSSVGTGVSWRPPGVQTKRTIWVTKDGKDDNSGLLEGDAKATIGAAAAIAQEGDTIKVRPGIYNENNPIGLRTDVSISGEDLRLVTVVPSNPLKDVIHVRRGSLVENLNFSGQTIYTSHRGAGAVAFPPPSGSESAVSGYTEPGPATAGSSGRWKSPYVRNCTNFMTESIGMKIDGDNASAASIGGDLKSMVCDSFTQYNEAGIGVSLTNDAYAQLVSIFTINTDIGIFAGSGGQCDLTNSNSSFGNFGLVAVGLGSTQFTGIVSNTNPAGEFVTSTQADTDTIVCSNVRDDSSNARRPFDGQALYFKIDLDNYPDTPNGIGKLTAPLEEVESIKLFPDVELGGYSSFDPPSVLIRDVDGTASPKGPQGIIAEASATVSAAGTISEINVVATGRNYLPSQNIVVDIEGNTGLATAVMKPIFYTVDSATIPTSAGLSTVTFSQFIPYELFPGDEFSLQRISRILTSSHSFEYVGTGTDINISTPLQGAIPIKANEIVASDGAQIPFTSTDQKGNFDIGEGIQIDQTTSTIRGRDFSRAIQAEVTPLILALR